MAKKIPKYTFTGESRTDADENYWYIYLLSSGKFAFAREKGYYDVFLAGGGSGGNGGDGNSGGAGGCGGRTLTQKGLSAAANQVFEITVGKGGAGGQAGAYSTAGGTTTAFGASAAGGRNDVGESIGSGLWASGGSGCGTGAVLDSRAGKGGSDGADGENPSYSRPDGEGFESGGKGQGTTTRAFGESTGALYAAGGGGGGRDGWVIGAKGGDDTAGDGGGLSGPASAATDAKPNTGSGGGGGYAGWPGGNGADGIVIIRGTQEDSIPVVFNGTEIDGIMFNGTLISSLIANGVTIY